MKNTTKRAVTAVLVAAAVAAGTLDGSTGSAHAATGGQCLRGGISMDLNWALYEETGSSLRYAEAVETGLWLMDNCGYEISSAHSPLPTATQAHR